MSQGDGSTAPATASGQDAVPTTARRGTLRPVRHRAGWVTSGLLLQLVGVGFPMMFVLAKAERESVGGIVTRATVLLAWHEALHLKSGAAVLAGGVVSFTVGGVLLARPFVRRRLTLLLAVPIASVGGVLVLGVLAAVVAVLFALLADGDTTAFGARGGPSRKKSDSGQADASGGAPTSG